MTDTTNLRAVKYRYSLSAIFLGLTFFIYTQPFYFWGMWSLTYAISAISSLILWYNLDSKINGGKGMLLLFILLEMILNTLAGNSIWHFIKILFIAPIPFIKRKLFNDSFKIFLNVYSFFLLLSIINYFLFLSQLPIPHTVIDSLNESKDYNMTAYPFLVVPNNYYLLFRFHGIFEEPGNIGTISVLLLGIDGFNYKKWQTWVLIVAGLLALSLFFYVATTLILLYFIITKKNAFIFKLFTITILGGFILFATTEGTVLEKYIGSRLVIDEKTNDIKGNNRSSDRLDQYYETIAWESPIFYYGSNLAQANKEEIKNATFGAASYKNAIIKYGLLGCILYLLFFYSLANSSKLNVRSKLLYMMFMIMVLWQRPFLLDSSFIYLFVAWIRLSKFNKYKHDVSYKEIPIQNNY